MGAFSAEEPTGAESEILFLFSQTVEPLLSRDLFGVRTGSGAVRFLTNGTIIDFSVFYFLFFSTFSLLWNKTY
jgi:hypothetical protein